MRTRTILPAVFIIFASMLQAYAQVAICPSPEEVYRGFSQRDAEAFLSPEKLYYPETWFHWVGGNVSEEGILADLEAMDAAGLSGLQWFHGDFGWLMPGIDKPLKAFTPEWNRLLGVMGRKARELGLRLSVQTCPGWAMAGGPWIEPKDAMRTIVWTRTDVKGGKVETDLPLAGEAATSWRDYQDICVLAFPTPDGDTGKYLEVSDVHGEGDFDWASCLAGSLAKPLSLPGGSIHTISFKTEGMVRTLVLPNVDSYSHYYGYKPDIHVTLTAILPGGNRERILDMDVPKANWQDRGRLELACDEAPGAISYELSVRNAHNMALGYVRFLSAARKNNWQGEAGWSLISVERSQEHTRQSLAAFVKMGDVMDISSMMDSGGHLIWSSPGPGDWTVLRIGHVNTGRKNSPAPPEATGWECNKFDPRGADIQFSNYVGRICSGPLEGLANGMLMDSWECMTQMWTDGIEEEFLRRNGYALRPWIPALLGYTVADQETTSRFLIDWRRFVDALYCENFFKRMTDLAHAQGLDVQFETAQGDVIPGDIMEYHKYADIPMCEFWQPLGEGTVADVQFKPVKPTASAAHVYGKTRVAAEALTSFNLTWDEHWSDLKEIVNFNLCEGATHAVFHTFTHNPSVGGKAPGICFNEIGTPFLREQTWWKHMKSFTSFIARSTYMLERGRMVSDVLWYLGDEVDHVPDQRAPFPAGFRYDYCNPDVLLHRLSVRNGLLVTPEGQEYKVLWIPGNERMLPETVEKLRELVSQGAVVVGNPPLAPATLRAGAEGRFKKAVKALWKGNGRGVRKIGKGKLAAGMSLDEALKTFGIAPDVVASSGLMWLHRNVDGADWYMVAPEPGKDFHGDVSFRSTGNAEFWNPTDGSRYSVPVTAEGGRSRIHLDLCRSQNAFIVFRRDGGSPAPEMPSTTSVKALDRPWTLSFPEGWGAPRQFLTSELKPLKDMDFGEEGRAFSGTVTYSTTFNLSQLSQGASVILDLGRVDMLAAVKVNGKNAGTVWAEPFTLSVGELVKPGENTLEIEVTTTWYNRLAYDSSRPEAERKTLLRKWLPAGSSLRDSGLLGPVVLKY